MAYAQVVERDGRFTNPNDSGDYVTVPPGAEVRYEIKGAGWPCVPHFGGTHPATADVVFSLR